MLKGLHGGTSLILTIVYLKSGEIVLGSRNGLNDLGEIRKKTKENKL